MDKARILGEVTTRIGVKQDSDKGKHLSLMLDVLEKLSGSSLVFKGGSCILICHKGTRFSEDLDFDAFAPRNLRSLLGSLASKYRAMGLDYKVENPKNTTTSSRYNIVVSGDDFRGLKLKIDISLRDLNYGVEKPKVEQSNGIEAYPLKDIFNQKSKRCSRVREKQSKNKIQRHI